MNSIIMRFYSIVILFAVLATSCDKFIDLSPPSRISQSQFYKSLTDFQRGINGLYSNLRDYYDAYYLYTDIPSDNSRASGTSIGLRNLDQMSWNSTDPYMERLWIVSYRIIGNANILLNRLENNKLVSLDEKNQFIGEIKFIRALMYFNLTQFYGDIPLVLKEIETEEQAYSYVRKPKKEIHTVIIEDLLTAINNLPLEYSTNEIGKITKGAAQSLLGRVYVTIGNYSNAVEILENVISSNRFELLEEYESIFDVNNLNNREIIFSIQYLAGGGFKEGSNFWLQFLPKEYPTTIGIPIGHNEGTLDLFHAFEEDDLRREISISQEFVQPGVFYTKKFLDNESSLNNKGNNNWPVIRYAEVFLLYSEALNEMGLTEKALIPLNRIRQRAGLSPQRGMSQADLRVAIQDERRVELCFEGFRWLDLIRTGSMVPTMRAFKQKYQGTERDEVGIISSYVIDQNRSLFPIPLREISLNPQITQNPGYN